jgi:hypothetical protein
MIEKGGAKPGTQVPGRFCVHLEHGRTGIPKMCLCNQECWHCAFDQWMDQIEETGPGEVMKAIAVETLAVAA